MSTCSSRFPAILLAFCVVSTAAVAADKPPEAAKPVPAVDLTSPKGALKALYGAIDRGDAAGITQAVGAPTKPHEKLRSLFAEYVAARARLREAVGAKFGKQAVPLDVDVPNAAAIDAARERIDGDRATVDLERANGEALKVKGEWKSAVLADLDAKAVDQALAAMAGAQAQIAAMNKSAASVAEGAVKSPDEARHLLAKYPMPFSVTTETAPAPLEGPGRP